MQERKTIITLYNQAAKADLPDNPKDQEKLRSEETILDLPEVMDIPGQEHIQPPKMKEMMDLTSSSDDEEGTGLVESLHKTDDEEELIVTGTDTDIAPEEVDMLERLEGFEASADNQNLADAALDSVDEDGEELNEIGFGEDMSGKDLDVTGSEDDDDMEDIGEEDEENNIYSEGDDKDTR
jgi:hypothetical protein